MYVIGTAGHVDHGKSSLVKALTGINPDRLKEEMDREMTIDLGFAWLTLANGEEVGIVDMPGHRDFIANMLAGVGGIDAVLLVIAADEGVMPQTREHLAIIDLLQINKGIIVLTKKDLVNDPDWIYKIEGDVHNLIKDTTLAGAPIKTVSVKTGEGMEEFKKELITILTKNTIRVDLGKPRLPIDRIFTMSGFGTVVTGTLLDGELRVGQEIVVLPKGRRGRIRGLQSYQKKHLNIKPGNRAAVNLSGIDVKQIKRGDVLTLPGIYAPTRGIYAHIRLLKDISKDIEKNCEVKIFLGSSENLARMKVLGSKKLHPGEEGWVKLESIHPMVTAKKDRFILRRPSPAETIGGGEVVEENPKLILEKQEKSIINHLEIVFQGEPQEIIAHTLLQEKGPLTIESLQKSLRLSMEDTNRIIRDLIKEEKILLLQGSSEHLGNSCQVLHVLDWQRLSGKIIEDLVQFHQESPLKRGRNKEELKNNFGLSTRFFQVLLGKMVSEGIVVEDGSFLRMPGFRIEFSPEQRIKINQLQILFEKNPLTPPTIADCIAVVGEEIFKILTENDTFVRISSDVVFDPKDLARLQQTVINYFRDHPTLTVAEFRDLVGTSRKYALAVLEYLDKNGITIREGESRVLVNKQPLTD
jgi:selenocysteine-specific elongation factor